MTLGDSIVMRCSIFRLSIDRMNTPTSRTVLHTISPLWRPEKVLWIYKDHNPDLVIDRIKSKSARKFVRAIDETMDQYSFELDMGVCTRKDFLNWLELYHRRSDEKQFELFATEAWFDEKSREQRKIEKLFIYQNGILIGGKIITISEDLVVRSAFKASIPFQFAASGNSSLGLMLDYLYLAHYSKQKVSKITGGRSRNLFGVINSIGYLCFKLRMGYSCEIQPNVSIFENEFRVPENRPFCTFLTHAEQEDLDPDLYFYGESLAQVGELHELQTLHSYLPFPTQEIEPSELKDFA